jgi:leucyl aminopeptidase
VRTVAHGADVMPLPDAAAPPAIRYRWRNIGYTLDDYLERRRVTGLLILKHGQVVAERYRYGRMPEARFLSFSMAKSVTSLLVGIALDKGLIASLDDPASRYVKDLEGSAYGATTVRHLLRMSSGIRFTERYDGNDDVAKLSRAIAGASALVRDLVNTPTEHMGPADLASTTSGIATVHGAKFHEWVGDDLLSANFPAIHAVGRASHRPPRLIQLTWGDARHPQVAIVGKGVCFDTGGLDIKGADFMRNMKKDMGGAAHAIALAELVMAHKLPVRINLLVPAVENAISGNAYRPGEVIRTRAGFNVEIDNTDAEGRVVLCDALAYAAQQRAELIVDFATLTGAARIALGPDLPALFANRDELAAEILACGRESHDPLWQLPLWQGYRNMLDSAVADFANSGPSRNGGAIAAALYLERFVPAEIPWAHIDVYSWNDADRPGRPRGGEAQSLRAMFRFLQKRYPRGG